MTISSSTRKAGPFTGNGTATTFPFTFKVFQASDLLVVRLNTSTNVESALVLNTDYTVSLNQNQNTNPGGSIVLGSVLATGFTLTATSDIQNLQPTDLTNQGGFYPTVINDALDRATIQIQQLQEKSDRSLKLPVSSTASSQLPGASANNLLAWNSTGDGLSNVDPASLVTVVAYSTAYADTFVGNGLTVNWTLSRNPAVLYNLDVSINGSTQVPGVDYTLSGTTFTTTSPAPIGAVILVKYKEGLPNQSGDSQDVRFVQAGSNPVARSVQSRLREYISIKDFGAVGDGITDDQVAYQRAIKAAGDTGVKRLYIPAGRYLIGLTTAVGGVALQDSAGNSINGLEIFGDGDASVLLEGTNANPNFYSLMGAQSISDLYVHDLRFDFNAARGALRPTPSSRFHNPAIQIAGAANNLRFENLSFVNCLVDQPVRIASFAPTPIAQANIANNVVFESCRWDYIGNGVPGNSQQDVSCVYIYGNNVQVNNCYWDGRVTDMSTIGSGGMTAFEYYGLNLVFSNNIVNSMRTGVINGNANGDYSSGNTHIIGNTFKNNLTLVDSASYILYKCGPLVFENNYSYTDANCKMGQYFIALANFLGGGQPKYRDLLVVRGNTFYYTPDATAASTGAYADCISTSTTETVIIENNSWYNCPGSIYRVEVIDNTQAVPSIYFRGNLCKNTLTSNTRRGKGIAPLFLEVIGTAVTINAFVVERNTFENWNIKGSRTGATSYVGPIASVSDYVSGKNFLVVNNTILGPNSGAATYGGAFTSRDTTTGNINATQTD